MIYGNFIGGEWVMSDDIAEVRNPQNDEIVTQYSLASSSMIESAIASSHEGAQAMRSLLVYERAAALLQLRDLLIREQDDFARTICLETAKPITESRTEVSRGIQVLTLAAEEAKRITGETIPLDLTPAGTGRIGLTRRFPVGPVTAISPYNFPLNLGLHKVAPAIAAGCSVIWKPSLLAPGVAFKFAELVQQTRLPKGAFNVITPTDSNAEPLITDSRMRLLSFTGSAAVGWSLMGKAKGKRTLLELGGNAAVIVGQDANLDHAVERCLVGGYAFSGQVCISVQRILVHKSLIAEFTAKFLTGVSKLKIGNPMDSDTQIGPMVSDKEANRVEEWITEAVVAGAQVLCGGGRRGKLIEPTVLTDVSHNTRAWQEELFGPVTILEPFDTLDEAIELVNESRYGLQAGIFTNDLSATMRAFERLEVGGVIVNDVPTFRADNMPYGGVKDSGLGREGVRYAMKEMTELRLMVLNTK